MDFGVFDHLDRTGPSLADYYEDRLKIIEAYDRAGFYAYHVAEHHSTPLGMAPSPNVFLSAIAQRTKRLRFGPLVYALPVHHPLRLLEEICMLDNLSGGRLELGFGRGSVAAEIEFFGVDPANAQEMYTEQLEIIIQGLTKPVLDFGGKYFSFDKVPMEFKPLQQPHPPIWYGVHVPESAERAAKRNLHVVDLDPPDATRIAMERYRATWRPQHPGATMPKLGLGRFVVVADTDAEALLLARRAYPVWHRAFTHLFTLLNRPLQNHPRPSDFDTLMARGQGVAGSPATVRDYLGTQLADTGCTYMVGQFAFGDLTRDECLRSIGLFAREVMPALRASESRFPDAVQREAVRR
jgi:alkanesulfonate monooxygenase SsuD/methylene tetrahydromethanopterin reductase-like flavin-dependent oxidoreductase (luciferase family)